MFDDLGIFNDPDVILAQTAVGRIPPNQLLQVAGGAVTNIQGASGQAVVFTSGGGSGFSLSAVGAGNAVTFTVSVSNAATARTALNAAQKATPAIVAATIPLAKITGGGVDGSITVNVEGIVTAYTAPT